MKMSTRRTLTTTIALVLSIASFLTTAPRSIADEGGKNGRTSLTGSWL
ncbi:MAG: hypothetical protein IPI24_02850 [Ignavibacteria bacterium]|nr:hypothetical protein [Ignavibacteria bacterium]